MWRTSKAVTNLVGWHKVDLCRGLNGRDCRAILIDLCHIINTQQRWLGSHHREDQASAQRLIHFLLHILRQLIAKEIIVLALTCQCDFDSAREAVRAASAAHFPQPVVSEMLVNGNPVWSQANPTASVELRPRDQITLRGSGFGLGPDVDFSKIMIGNSRVLETDLRMFEQRLDLTKQVNFELPQTHSNWDKDIISWQDDEITFYVPEHASDGHVRNLEDLVNPQRCTEGSPLYRQYYTLHAPARPPLGSADQPVNWPDLNRKGDVFRVPKSKTKFFDPVPAQRNRFIERHRYFTTVSWDKNHYYWDYQKMRSQYGPAEMGTPSAINLPATPHPWCAASSSDVSNIVQYVLTL